MGVEWIAFRKRGTGRGAHCARDGPFPGTTPCRRSRDDRKYAGPMQINPPARIKGRGAPELKGSGRGDVLACVRIQVPKRVNKKERELLEQLQKATG